MAKIETRDESNAVALAAIVANTDDDWSSNDRMIFVRGWCAGRDWDREQTNAALLTICPHHPKDADAIDCVRRMIEQINRIAGLFKGVR